MSYLTLEVEIDHGKIVARDLVKLPERGGQHGIDSMASDEAAPVSVL